jgi:hypothetical protein
VAQGARTPEEVDALLEDAFVLRDPEALASRFEARALLVAGAGAVRRSEEIALSASGGFENLVTEMSVPAERRTPLPPSDEEPDWDHVARGRRSQPLRAAGVRRVANLAVVSPLLRMASLDVRPLVEISRRGSPPTLRRPWSWMLGVVHARPVA